MSEGVSGKVILKGCDTGRLNAEEVLKVYKRNQVKERKEIYLPVKSSHAMSQGTTPCDPLIIHWHDIHWHSVVVIHLLQW